MPGHFTFCEAEKLNIKEQLDVFYSSVMDRLIPSFSTLEKEMAAIEKESLNSRSKHFDPDSDDEACIEEDAYFDGINHYMVQSQMKQSLQNVSTLWLYHLFEQQLNNISFKIIEEFDYTKQRKSRQQLNNCLIEKGLDSNVNWQKINNELRLVANTLKHAEGSSKRELAVIRADLFTSNFASTAKATIPLFENEICISELDFKNYYQAVVGFWDDFFMKMPIMKKTLKCRG